MQAHQDDQNQLDAETKTLNTKPTSSEFTEKPFENSVDHFGAISETRNYMRVRHAHVGTLLEIKNRTAVQSALGHLLDMLRLDRRDTMGVRDLIPGLYIRLDRYQECYDFLKWWSIRPNNLNDWENDSEPFLNIKNANALEALVGFGRAHHTLTHYAMLYLFKVRMVLNIVAIELVIKHTEAKLPPQLLEEVLSHITNSALKNNSALWQDIKNCEHLHKHKTPLLAQLDALLRTIDGYNRAYLLGVVEPESHYNAKPPMYAARDIPEMQVALAQTYDAWLETPGSLAFLDGVLGGGRQA